MPDPSTAAESAPPRLKQPNSQHCFVCGVENRCGLGLRFFEAGPDRLEAEYRVPERYQGYPGVVHGGVVAAMLDEMVSRTTMIGRPGHFMVTARLDISYRAPVPVEAPLHLTGRLTRRRGRFAFAHAELRLDDGTLAAEAEGMMADFPDGHAPPEQLEALGWRVYPD